MKIEIGTDVCVRYEGNTVRCHLRADGLGAVMVSDGEYPERVAFSVLSNLIEEFSTLVG